MLCSTDHYLSFNVKPLGLKHLLCTNMAVSSCPPDGARWLYSRTPFLMERPLLLRRRGPNIFGQLSFRSDQYDTTRSAAYQESPLDNGLFRPSRLVPWRVVLIGTCGCAYRPLWRALRCSSKRWWLSYILSATLLGRCGVSRQLTSSTSMCDVAVEAVSSASRANSTWLDGVDTSSTCRMNRTGDIIPSWAMPDRMPLLDVVKWSPVTSHFLSPGLKYFSQLPTYKNLDSQFFPSYYGCNTK